MKSESEIKEVVSNGVKWLNEVRPGWINNINLDKLNMKSCKTCMIGQLFEDYYSARNLMFPGLSFTTKTDWAIEHGFYDTPDNDNWKNLQKEWIAEIVRLKAAVAESVD